MPAAGRGRANPMKLKLAVLALGLGLPLAPKAGAQPLREADRVTELVQQ